jgi:catechol 2,3-dioxygenase-like lactoylglutathione lyase family enzyme
MLHYVTLGSNNLARSRAFYDAALAPLGFICHIVHDDEIGYGPSDAPPAARQCHLWILNPVLKLPATWGNGTMVALTSRTRSMVDSFHEAAIRHGGIDEGKPGLRPFHDDYYAAYVRDPDGNKLSAVCEHEGRR